MINEIDCSSSVSEIDQAKLAFSFPAVTSVDSYYAVYGVNHDCYECSWTLLSSQIQNVCVTLSTTFGWDLYLAKVDTAQYQSLHPYSTARGERPVFVDHTSPIIPLSSSAGDDYIHPNNLKALHSLSHLFQEHADYSLTVDDAVTPSMSILKTKDGVDSFMPLYLLITILSIIAIVAFNYEAVWKRVMESSEGSSASAREPLLVSEEAGTISQENTQAQPAQPKRKKAARLRSLDTFRGLSLMCMIFVNYGGGGYWFFSHAAWNGLTFADLLFPWFMWIMGVSMALSFSNILPEKPQQASYPGNSSQFQAAVNAYNKEYRSVWYKAVDRSVKLSAIGLFLNNGYSFTNWRIPGVLQYFGVSYFVVSATVLSLYPYTQDLLKQINAKSEFHKVESEQVTSDEHIWSLDRVKAYFNIKQWSYILLAYRYEWVIQIVIAVVYLAIALGGKAPGCPRGYNGPGGISEDSKHFDCTGGIHRYIDGQIFGFTHYYHDPTCVPGYSCVPYDPEGLLGSLMACTLTYLGLMTGRIFLHYKQHMDRLLTMWIWAAFLLLLAGILCGFSQNHGVIPVNKNLWSTSFVLVTSGFGLVGLSWCYIPIDIYKVWTGAPMIYLGMNSIIIYCGHEVLEAYFPFSYELDSNTHGNELLCNCVGVLSWVVIAFYFYKIKFFVKI